MIPTKKQIQWFWEQCGFNLSCYGHGLAWFINNEKLFEVVRDDQEPYEALPPIDLNNLFKYAVPKLGKSVNELGYIGFQGWFEYHVTINFKDRIGWRRIDSDDKNPALALFWAIYKALGGKE